MDYNIFLFLPFTFIFYIAYRKHEIAKYLALGIVLLNINAIQISFSKGALIALMFFFIVLNTLILRYRLISIKELVKINSLIIILSTLLISPYFKTALNQLKFYESTSQTRSISGRLNTVESALQIFKENKITGVGSFNFSINNVKFKGRQDDIVFTSKLPNTLLQILVEKGIIGLISYIALFVVFLAISIKTINNLKSNKLYGIFSSLLLSACASIIIKELSFASVFNNTLVMVFLGVICAFIINLFNHSDNNNKEYRFNNIVMIICCAIVLSYSLFITYNHISYARAAKFNRNYVEALKNGNFLEAQQLINKVIEIEPENALYQSNRGLINERELKLSISPGTFILNEESLFESEKDSLKEAVGFYKNAAKLNPEDESFYHNIAWIYLLLNETDSAKYYFDKCIKIEPTIAIYHISFGMYYEKSGQIEKACQKYCDAVRLSPDILDSRFFNDFQKRHSHESNALIRQLIEDLKEKSEKNIIIRSRLAKLMMNAGKRDTALLLFKNITTEMPNLNRPWYYMAQLSDSLDKEDVELYYQRSFYLDRNDYLPSYELANLFFEQGKYELAENQYLLTVKNWQNSYSIHSQRARNMYLSIAPNNDIIPEFLVNYIKPTININMIYKRLGKITDN